MKLVHIFLFSGWKRNPGSRLLWWNPWIPAYQVPVFSELPLVTSHVSHFFFALLFSPVTSSLNFIGWVLQRPLWGQECPKLACSSWNENGNRLILEGESCCFSCFKIEVVMKLTLFQLSNFLGTVAFFFSFFFLCSWI